MRAGHDVLHLAMPVHDLQMAEDFDVGLLGCKLARRSDDRITLDSFGDQLVCNLNDPSPGPRLTLGLYPRHFRVTFRNSEDFDAPYDLCVQRKVPFFAEMSTRFGDLVESHQTLVAQTRRTT